MDSPPESSQSRRWADYSDDEEDFSPRSYCEVLRSGTPPAARSPAPSPVAVSSKPASPPRVAPLRHARSPPAPAPQQGAPRPWLHGGGGGWPKRRRGPQLPALVIRDDLPPDLAGNCFNCAQPGHISRECPNDTKCLKCKEDDHHDRDCPQATRRLWPAAQLGGNVRAGQRAVDGERWRAPVEARACAMPAAQRGMDARAGHRAVEGERWRAPVEARVGATVYPPPQQRFVEHHRAPVHERIGVRTPPRRRSTWSSAALRCTRT